MFFSRTGFDGAFAFVLPGSPRRRRVLVSLGSWSPPPDCFCGVGIGLPPPDALRVCTDCASRASRGKHERKLQSLSPVEGMCKPKRHTAGEGDQRSRNGCRGAATALMDRGSHPIWIFPGKARRVPPPESGTRVPEGRVPTKEDESSGTGDVGGAHKFSDTVPSAVRSLGREARPRTVNGAPGLMRLDAVPELVPERAIHAPGTWTTRRCSKRRHPTYRCRSRSNE